MNQVVTMAILISVISAMPAAAPPEGISPKGQFQNTEVAQGSKESMVREIRATVIIPGDSHEGLWVHPTLVTIPGKTIKIELFLRSTDRWGRDQHTVYHYFRTDDAFQTLVPIDKPTAEAWDRIGLNRADFQATDDQGPQLPVGGWSWARSGVCLDAETIIYPITTREDKCHSIQTVVARRRGEKLVPLYVSNALTNQVKRGFLEPQIAQYNGRLYMTMRAEDGFGYVSASEDRGRFWHEPQAWRWSDGEKIAMHTTQTKLLSHSDGLLLVYTRIREDNRNVFRSRAPLFCADVEPATLSLRQSTERVLIPNRGLPVGNFWVWPIDQTQSCVTATEWPRDGRATNGDTWFAKIYWKKPNQQMTTEGRERATLKAE